MINTDQLAKRAYNAFTNAHGNTGPNNERATPYEQLAPEARTAWLAVAREIAEDAESTTKAKGASG